MMRQSPVDWRIALYTPCALALLLVILGATSARAAHSGERGTVVLEHPDEGVPLAFSASPRAKPITTPRRVKVLSNLALAALLSAMLLTLSLWLGGIHVPLLSSLPDQPSLNISSGPYRVGSSITLQGAHFSRYTIIVLLLDGQPAVDSNGLRQAVDSDGQGAFTATLTITPAWSPGDHILDAKDTTSGLQAVLNISIEDAASLRGD
jgi:hypothetical protein